MRLFLIAVVCLSSLTALAGTAHYGAEICSEAEIQDEAQSFAAKINELERAIIKSETTRCREAHQDAQYYLKAAIVRLTGSDPSQNRTLKEFGSIRLEDTAMELKCAFLKKEYGVALELLADFIRDLERFESSLDKSDPVVVTSRILEYTKRMKASASQIETRTSELNSLLNSQR